MFRAPVSDALRLHQADLPSFFRPKLPQARSAAASGTLAARGVGGR